jgi:lysozyme
MRGRSVALIILGVAAGAGIIAWSFLNGFIRFNCPSAERYPVRGLDVSHHQSRIDWLTLRAQGYTFAFIKATEGADHRDSLFSVNWLAAQRVGLSRGAYHFFTFCTPGEPQAANFIETVGPVQEMLPPVADVEFIGNCANPPGVAQIRAELATFLERVELAYSRKPILYVTGDSYERIVKGDFSDYPIWIRNIFCEPDPGWAFWQYADRGRVNGVPTLVDLNVFHGSAEVFRACVALGRCAP